VCEVLIRNYNLKVLAGENHPTQHKTKTIFGSISLMEHGLKEMGKNIFSLPTGYHHLVASCTGMYHVVVTFLNLLVGVLGLLFLSYLLLFLNCWLCMCWRGLSIWSSIRSDGVRYVIRSIKPRVLLLNCTHRDHRVHRVLMYWLYMFQHVQRKHRSQRHILYI
jgi:hypothetical protein